MCGLLGFYLDLSGLSVQEGSAVGFVPFCGSRQQAFVLPLLWQKVLPGVLNVHVADDVPTFHGIVQDFSIFPAEIC